MAEPFTILVHHSPGVVTLSSRKQRAPAQHEKRRGRLGFLASDWNYFYLRGVMLLQVSFFFFFFFLNSGGCFFGSIKALRAGLPRGREFSFNICFLMIYM